MLLDDLKLQIKNKKAVLFIGTGVLTSASCGHTNYVTADWIGLLRDGIDPCVSICHNLSNIWKGRMLAAIDSLDMLDLLATAERIETRLKALGGQYSRWLRETVGQLSITNLTIINAIKFLGLPIVTTNYDDFLEKGTGLDRANRAVSKF
jgi:hypothetical protein